MIEDLPDDIVTEDDLDDIEPVGDEAQLYEHFRVVVDRGQEMMRVDKYLFDRLTNASRNRIQKSAEAGFVMANNKPVKRTTKRRYRALVWGTVEQDEGTITGNIGRNPRDRMQMTVLPNDQGKHAVTHYRVLERLGYVTLVECILETGRTHQIRVHMKHIGHVLFNDERYGGHEILKGTHFSKYKQFVNNCFDTCPRQALHAMTLGFVHPATGEEMYFTSEMPEDMTLLIDKWRGYISNRDLE